MSCQVYIQCFILEPVPVSYVMPNIHPVFYIGTSACILCRAKYTPSVLYWNQCLYPMSCQVYTQCFILEPVPVSHVMPSIHPVFYTGTSARIPCRAKYTPIVLYWNQCLYPMSCQVYTQCFILEPVPVSYVMPSIHQVFNTGTSACVLCHAKYTSSVLYWNQYLYPMSCQIYTQCFILEPVLVSYVMPSIQPVFYTGTSVSCQVYSQCFILEPILVSYVVPSIHTVFYTGPVPVSYVMPSIHQVFNTGTSACVLCHAKYTSSVLYWNQYLYPMSCQIYTQCFILEPVLVSYVVPSIHPVFYTGTSACIPCRAKYTPSVLYWNQCLYPMSCQVYTQCFILEPVPVSHVVPSIHPLFYTGTSACIPCRAKYTSSVLYWNQCLYPMSFQVCTQCFILEPVPVSHVVPSIHPLFYTGTSACIPCRAKYTPSVLYRNQYPVSCQVYTQCFL